MIVNSQHIEFGYELLSVLPYAYHIHQKGQLEGTISGYDTDCLYYFSPNHKSIEKDREFNNILLCKHFGIPNTTIHRPELDWSVWNPPPLKEYYFDKRITFDKPTVCICNRYTNEWDSQPINYFDLDELRYLFAILIDKYQVVYINVNQTEYQDNNKAKWLGDYEMITEEYPMVITMNDIYNDHIGMYTYNQVQLRVFAGCDRFITMNGGLSILASYFGGENIIYTKQCQEINPKINSFNKWYHRIGGSFINVVNTYDQLNSAVKTMFVENNVGKTYFLYNTQNRKNTLFNIKQILSESSYNRIVVFVDSYATSRYLLEHKCIIDETFIKDTKVLSIPQELIDYYSKGKDYILINVSNNTANRKANVKTISDKKHHLKNYDIPLNSYEEYDDIGNEEFAFDTINHERIVLYTACSKNYKFKRDDIICFNPKPNGNDVMDAKVFKILGHKYFPKADILIWVDANIFPKITVEEMVEKYLSGADLAICKHPIRDCLYEERNEIRNTQRLQIKEILDGLDRQYNDYKADGYPLHNGLWECNFIIRRNKKEVNDLFKRWWEHINKYQQRDQVSFPYVLWKYGKEVNFKTITTGDIRKNTDFVYMNHY